MAFTLSISNITATHATLTWTALPDFAGGTYKIYRNGDLVHTNASDDSDWGDDGLAPGTAYAFRVDAYAPYGGGIINSTNTVNIVTPAAPPAPSLLTVTPISASQLNLDWQDNSSDELDFHAEESDDGVTGWAETTPPTVAANVIHYERTGLAGDMLKYFRVRAHSAAGYSAYSNIASGRTLAAIAQPTNFKVTAYSGTEVDFSFDDNSTAEDDHRLERKTGGGAFAEVQTVAANVTGGRNGSLSPGVTYVFRIRAKQGGSYSAYSEEVTVTTIAVPGAPSAIVISELQDTTTRLTWTPPTTGGAVVGYRIESSPDDSTWTEIAQIYTQVCSYRPTGLTASQLVYFRIRAFNAAGDGDYCASASTTTLAAYAPSAFETWLRNPVGTPIILSELNPKLTLEGWALKSGATYTYQVTISIPRVPIDAVYENGIALTAAATITAVETTAGSWYFDFYGRILCVHSSDGTTPASFFVEASLWIYLTNYQDGTIIFNDHNYLNFLRADGVSELTQELTGLHEGNFIISHGTLQFINALQDGGTYFFDKLHSGLTWINRKVRNLIGAPGFTYAQFAPLFTALISRHRIGDESFAVDLVDPREGIHRDLPINHYWQTEYPALADGDQGKEKPWDYGHITGAPVVCLDAAAKKYGYHDGKCKGLVAVRINAVAKTVDVDYFDDPARGILTFVSTLTIADSDIIDVDFDGRMSGDNVLLENGALIFKDICNVALEQEDAELDLDSFWETKAAKTYALKVPLHKTQNSQEVIRTLEHSLGAYTMQDPEGRIGLKVLTSTLPSSAVRVLEHQLFGLTMERSRDALAYKTVNVFHSPVPGADTWSQVTRTSAVMGYKYRAKKSLDIYTYLSTAEDAGARANEILADLEQDKSEFNASQIMFGVQAGDLIIFTRPRYFDAQGTAVDKTLRVVKVGKSVGTMQTGAGAEEL